MLSNKKIFQDFIVVTNSHIKTFAKPVVYGYPLKLLIILFLCLMLSNCFFGGLVVKGGHNLAPAWYASATQTKGLDYDIICERNPGDQLPAVSLSEKKSSSPNVEAIEKTHLFTRISRSEYKGGCEQTGQTSVYYILNMWPLTDPLDPDYAIATAVQKLEGDTMINIHIWHEVHYYGLVGRVYVMYARGDVVRYK